MRAASHDPTNWPSTLPLVMAAIGCAYLGLRNLAAQSRMPPVVLLVVSLVVDAGRLGDAQAPRLDCGGWGGVLLLAVAGVVVGAAGAR